MTITLTTAEQQELAEQTKRDPAVIMSFYEWYGRLRQSAPDDVTACQLALQKQREVFWETYQSKVALYVKEARQDYRARLLNLKRLPAGPRFKTKSGIRVRSKAEKIIADFLFERGLQFAYEPIIELDGYYVMPDFHLTDYDVYLEHFGRDDHDYLQSAQAKLERYRQANVHLVWTCSAEEPDIEEILTWKLREAGVPV
jgi:predicted nuclease of restriction endonuclease-like RecB superfamily